MRKLLAAAVLALLLPAAAHAKGMAQIDVCGPDSCADAGSGTGDFFNFGGTTPGPPPGEYYELRLTFEGGAGHSQGIYYEPQSGLASYSESFGNPRWAPLREPFAARVKEAAKRVEPFPEPRLTAVYVGDRRVRSDPESYLQLFGLEGPFVIPTRTGTMEFIRFESPDANPWTTAAMAFYPREGVLVMWGTYVKLPPPLAADLAAARPLGGTPGGGAELPWIPIGAAILGVLVLLGLGLRRASAREVAPVH